MDSGTDLDQALEGNVLSAVKFEKAVRDVLHWLHKEQTTFNRYLDSHPSVRDTTVATFQSIIRTVPLSSPAATRRVDDHHEQEAPSPPSIPEQILRREQPNGTRRAQPPVPPKDLLIDEVESDDRLGYVSCGQHESQRRPYTPELSDRGTPTSIDPSHNSNLEHNPAYLGIEQVYYILEPTYQTEVEITKDAEDEQAGHDVSQEVPANRDLNTLQPVLDGQSVADRSVALPPATPSTCKELEPLSPPKPRVLKRKRKSGSREGQRSEQGEKLGQDSPSPDPLPVTVTRRVLGIASFETVVFLWDRLQLLSDLASDLGQSLIYDDQSWYEASMQTLPRRQRLEMLWSRIGDNARNERWARVLRRICQAEFFGQYLEERASFDRWREDWKAQRAGRTKRYRTARKGKEIDAWPLSHPLEEYVDLCFPETILRKGDDLSEEAMVARSRAKKKFDNLLRKNEPWVRLSQRFGTGLIAVAPDDLRDEHLRKLNKDQLDPLLDLIDTSKPCLREQLESLSKLLSVLIEHNRLPLHKLQLQMLSRDQLESMRSKDWSLEELLEPCLQYEGEALDIGISSNECPIIDDYEGQNPDSGTLSNKCPIDDDCRNQEDWSTYLDLPRDLDLSAQSTSPLPIPLSLLHLSRTATPDTHSILSTQICEQDSSSQLASYILNTTDINDSLPESYLDLLYLSSPLVLPPLLYLVQ